MNDRITHAIGGIAIHRLMRLNYKFGHINKYDLKQCAIAAIKMQTYFEYKHE